MSETTNLKLFKHDNPSTNTNPFDVEQALNDNWNKIDTAVGDLQNNNDSNKKDIADLKKRVTEIENDLETVQTDITNIKEEQTTQNNNIETNGAAIETNAENIKKNETDIQALQEENANLKAQIPTGKASGEEISLSDSANLELIDFSIAINNPAHLVVSNKNLLSFSKVGGNGITFDKNRITIIDPSGYFYAGSTLVGGNKFLSGKRVIFTAISNGTISTGALDFTIHTNKTQYRFQKKHGAGTYNNDVKSEAWQFANDEYITSIFVYTTGATCNLTIDVQVSIIDAEFVEHEGAEFDITADNLLAVVNQIKRNGTYKNVTHFYTTDETHPSMSLEYYKDLETLFNKQAELENTLNNVQAQILELGGN